jgi:UDP-perosamine 4-acetyltransferase
MKKNVVVYGSSYPDAIEILQENNSINIIGYINDFSSEKSKWLSDIEYLGNYQIMEKLDPGTLILNNVWSHKNRKLIYQRITSHGFDMYSYFSDDIFLPKSLQVGQGNWMHRGVKVGSKVIIGDNCGFRFNSIINHECSIGSHSFLGPGVILSGKVSIGENTFLGSGSIILPNVSIGNNVIVGAGSTVTKNIPSNKIAFGNPAKVRN